MSNYDVDVDYDDYVKENFDMTQIIMELLIKWVNTLKVHSEGESKICGYIYTQSVPSALAFTDIVIY